MKILFEQKHLVHSCRTCGEATVTVTAYPSRNHFPVLLTEYRAQSLHAVNGFVTAELKDHLIHHCLAHRAMKLTEKERQQAPLFA